MARQPSDNRRQSVTPALEADNRAEGDMQPPLRSRPANENDPTTAMMLGRLRRRPSYDVIWVSLLVSMVWALGCLWIYKDALTGTRTISQTEFLQAIALLVLPVFGMTTIAYFLWRAQQLRQVSEVLMHQAMRLIRPQDLAADGLSTIAQAVRQEVDLLVGGVEHAVQRASALEEIVHKEIAAVERAFGSNEDRIRNLVHGLENQRAALQQTSTMVSADAQPMLQRLETNTHNLNEVVTLALSTFGRLEDGLKGSTAELAHTIETVSQRASETGAEIGNHAQQFERMSTMLVTDFRGFASQLQENIQGLTFTASSLGTETRKFGTEVRDMEQNLVHLLQQSSDRLASSHSELSSTIVGVVGQVDQSSIKLLGDLESSTMRFNERFLNSSGQLMAGIENHSQNLVTQLSASGTGFMGSIQQASEKYTRALGDATERLDQSAGAVVMGLGQTSQQLSRDLQLVGNNVNDLLVSTSGTIAAHLKDTSEIVGRQMQDSGIALAQTIESSGGSVTDRLLSVSGDFVQKMEGTQHNLMSSFVEATGDLTSKLEETAGAVHGRLRDTADLVLENLGSLTGDINEKLLTTVTASNGRMTETAESLLGQLGAVSSEVNEKLLTTIDASNGRLQDTAESVLNQLGSISSQVNEKLLTTIDASNGRLQETADSLLNQLGAVSSEVNEKLLTTIDASNGRLQDTADSVLSQLGSMSSEVNDKLLITIDASNSRLVETADSLLGQLNSISSGVNDRLIVTSSSINDKLRATSETTTHHMANVTQSLSAKLDQTAASLGNLLTVTEARLGNHMEQSTVELDALFSQNSKMLTEQLENASDTITKSFAERATETIDTLNGAAITATNKIDDASQAMFARLNGSASELGKRFDDARDHLESVTLNISQRMDGQGRRFADLLDESSSQIFTDLGKARDAFAEGLGETTLQISGRFEQETGMLVGRIDRAIHEFTASADTSSGKLDEAADKFGHHVANTNNLLASQLAGAAADIDTRLENVATQLTGKLEVASSRISERLDDVSSLVEKSIDKFNNEIEQTLTSRRDMLDSLVNDANRRATAVDKAMSDYMSIIDNNMETAETRAKHISQIVSDQSSAALARLEEELQRLESSSSSQVVQAARALREQQERALTSMNEMLASTAADFQQTAQDMRITAQQVVKDIDSARDELKRAVIDLPEETRSNADNMRRVVADQISALNQLADVVRKQSVSLDYSSPGFVSSRTGTGPAKTEIVSAPASASRASNLARETPRLSERKANSLAKDVDGFTAKLNIAARDVVESMEGQLPRDLERRYAADKSAYATRLYELRSRKTIKSLEERYADERLLRSRIQAYNRLFEKLLDTISDADGSDAVMEEVLASEHGRVYVMLAEAAGRLPSQS